MEQWDIGEIAGDLAARLLRFFLWSRPSGSSPRGLLRNADIPSSASSDFDSGSPVAPPSSL